ncbi:urea amidolyase associated protein UAAP1 [Acidomonas methanolica]|uniref:urea amidolyase associated protein UAAP1 n=1 Tax=Acidomonas methanolica TaxID=437 RepID=UPI00211A392C|nr:urea carboxylase-associated family protein [Acidomonas methanolica]
MTDAAKFPALTPTLHRETIPGGGHRSLILRAGQRLRLTDTEGGANLALMALNASQMSERLNLPDSLKAQHTAYVTSGHCLYSDMGRVLLAITEDTCGWHDCFGGVLNAVEVEDKYGSGTFGRMRNGFYRNGFENLLVELGKWNLDARDIQMVVNFFSKVAVADGGHLHYISDHSKRGCHVDLYAPMDTLVVMTAVQHPMDLSPHYDPKPVEFAIDAVQDTSITAACRRSCSENGRAFYNTELFCL